MQKAVATKTTTVAPRRSRRKITMPATPVIPSNQEFHEFVHRVQNRFMLNCGHGKQPLFHVAWDGPPSLFDLYLTALPQEHRQHHNCDTCRHFINRYGSLATVDAIGAVRSALWDASDAPAYYASAVSIMQRAVEQGTITEAFLTSHAELGPKSAGWDEGTMSSWSHFGITVPEAYVSINFTRDVANKRHNMENVRGALAEFAHDIINKVVTLMQLDAVCRAEKFIEPARWLLERSTEMQTYRANGRAVLQNLLWRATSQAPDGFCHVRSGMLGMLLSDVATIERQRGSYSGGVTWTDDRCTLELEKTLRAFEQRCDPLAYQRPQAEPKAGTIKQANRLVVELGVEDSLKRRWMARAEVPELLWEPRHVRSVGEVANGVPGRFDYLKKAPRPPVPDHIPSIHAMSWAKFKREVLPLADKMVYHVHERRELFCALVTAEVADSKPLLKYDLPERRNPASCYTYASPRAGGSVPGTMPAQFGLTPRTQVEVTGICKRPHQWYGADVPGETNGVVFLLAGCRDVNNPGLAIFPEDVRRELHSIRSVIEAASASESMGELPEGMEYAAGVLLGQHGEWGGGFFTVTVGTVSRTYQIDRWE